MKWELDYGWKVQIMDNIDDVVEAILDQMDSAYFDDMLDECCQQVEVCSYVYTPSEVLKSCDPVAYDYEFENYKDNLSYDIGYDLDRMYDGEQTNFYGVDVTCIDEEEEEEED